MGIYIFLSTILLKKVTPKNSSKIVQIYLNHTPSKKSLYTLYLVKYLLFFLNYNKNRFCAKPVFHYFVVVFLSF